MTPEEKKKNDKISTRLLLILPIGFFIVFLGEMWSNGYVVLSGFIVCLVYIYLLVKFVKPTPKCDTCGGTGIKK